MAHALGEADVERTFLARAQAYRHLFDPSTGFLRAKRNGAFLVPFDPTEVNSHYTEANAWQYAFFVPQDTEGLVRLHGGRAAFAAFLDRLFAAPAKTTGRDQPDISGLIGQYAHGNEPSHHIAYLYCHAGQPWKTQQRVREILDTLYADAPDGLSGNEDCGQMSAWYVISALGFFPVTPGTAEYVIGTPLFPSAAIHLENGRTFTVRAPGAGAGSPYVQRATLHGSPLRGPVLAHADVVAGGELVLEMGPSPSRWGSAEDEVPRTELAGPPVVAVPVVANGERFFRGSAEIAFATVDGPGVIHVSTDDGKTFAPYTAPIHVERTSDLVAYAARDGRESPRIRAHFLRVPHDWTIHLATRYASQYPATGDAALIDGLHGREAWWTGDWQGYDGDVDATLDLLAPTDLHVVRVGFLQDVKSWIWLPKELRVEVSDDGKAWRPFGTATHDVAERLEGRTIHPLEVKGDARARFVRIVAQSRGPCPDWHPGHGHKSWIFADEIEVDPAK